jgi:hypothetical protein
MPAAALRCSANSEGRRGLIDSYNGAVGPYELREMVNVQVPPAGLGGSQGPMVKS